MNNTSHPPSCFIRSILMTPQQGRLYKTYTVNWLNLNAIFFKHLAIYVRNVYIQIQMDSDIQHVF